MTIQQITIGLFGSYEPQPGSALYESAYAMGREHASIVLKKSQV